MSCLVCADLLEKGDVLLIQEWRDEQSLMSYLQTDSMRVVLSALEYSSNLPEVRFEMVTEIKGLDFIAACRLGPGHGSLPKGSGPGQ